MKARVCPQCFGHGTVMTSICSRCGGTGGVFDATDHVIPPPSATGKWGYLILLSSEGQAPEIFKYEDGDWIPLLDVEIDGIQYSHRRGDGDEH